MKRTLLALPFLLSPLVLAPPAAALSCVDAATVIKDAPQVYAGKVVDARDGKVRVAVEEVWKGGAAVPSDVWLPIEEGMEFWMSWGQNGEIPEGFSTRDTWVFAPHQGQIGACSTWARDGIPELRPEQPLPPAEAPAPTPEPVPDDDNWSIVAGVGVGGAAVLAGLGGLVWWRRRG